MLSSSFLIFNQANFLLLSRCVVKLQISFLETRVESVSNSQVNGERGNADDSCDPVVNDENIKESIVEDKPVIGI